MGVTASRPSGRKDRYIQCLRSGATLPPARWNQGGAYEAKKETECNGTECEPGAKRRVKTKNPPKGVFVTA